MHLFLLKEILKNGNSSFEVYFYNGISTQFPTITLETSTLSKEKYLSQENSSMLALFGKLKK
jgi:hypothetical protein